jgi:hypothetical protein
VAKSALWPRLKIKPLLAMREPRAEGSLGRKGA